MLVVVQGGAEELLSVQRALEHMSGEHQLLSEENAQLKQTLSANETATAELRTALDAARAETTEVPDLRGISSCFFDWGSHDRWVFRSQSNTTRSLRRHRSKSPRCRPAWRVPKP
jgi:hypothetical protein